MLPSSLKKGWDKNVIRLKNKQGTLMDNNQSQTVDQDPQVGHSLISGGSPKDGKIRY